MTHPFKVGDIVRENHNPDTSYKVIAAIFKEGIPFVRLESPGGLWRASLFIAPKMPPTKHKLGVPKGVLP